MERDHGTTTSRFSISKNDVFSFEWKIKSLKLQECDLSFSSPEFYYKKNKYPWFLQLTATEYYEFSFIKLDMCHNSTEKIDLEFSITVSRNDGIPCYKKGGSAIFTKLRPVTLITNVLDPHPWFGNSILINCSIQVRSVQDVESHTKSLTSISLLSPDLNKSDSQNSQQCFSNQINNNSGKAEWKVQSTRSHLKKKKAKESTVRVPACNSEHENTPDDSPDFETLKQLSFDFKRMFIEAKNTDFTIRVEDTTIKAHKAVLDSRSPVFCKMFEHFTLEATNNEIEVTDIRAPVMKKLIYYLYSGGKGCLQYDEACELYYAADKYEILNLREACMKDLLSLLAVNNACPMLSLAYRHSDDVFKDKVMDFISRNFNSIANTESWIELTDKDTKLAALLMRHCARVITK